MTAARVSRTGTSELIVVSTVPQGFGEPAGRIQALPIPGDGGLVVAVALDDGGVSGWPLTYSGEGYGALIAGDVNEDGFPDLIVTENSGLNASILIVLSTPDGGFASAVELADGATSISSPIAQNPGLRVLDVDGDGHQDILVSSFQAIVFYGSGRGDFSLAGPFGNVTQNGSPIDVAAGPLTLTGVQDIVTVEGCCGNLTDEVDVLLGTSSRSFSQLPFDSVLGAAEQIALADVNQDGILDLVLDSVSPIEPAQAPPSGFAVMLGNGDATFQPEPTNSFAAPIPISGMPLRFAVGDYTQDGVLDLIASESDTQTGLLSTYLAILPGVGDGTFGAEQHVPLCFDPKGLEVTEALPGGQPALLVHSTTAVAVIALGQPLPPSRPPPALDAGCSIAWSSTAALTSFAVLDSCAGNPSGLTACDPSSLRCRSPEDFEPCNLLPGTTGPACAPGYSCVDMQIPGTIDIPMPATGAVEALCVQDCTSSADCQSVSTACAAGSSLGTYLDGGALAGAYCLVNPCGPGAMAGDVGAYYQECTSVVPGDGYCNPFPASDGGVFGVCTVSGDVPAGGYCSGPNGPRRSSCVAGALCVNFGAMSSAVCAQECNANPNPGSYRLACTGPSESCDEDRIGAPFPNPDPGLCEE